MTKQEFLMQLRKGLSGLPKKEVEGNLEFYAEMIDDRIEEGLLEEDAVAQIGNVDTVVEEIIAQIPLSKLVKERIRGNGKKSGLAITLLSVGALVWVPLLISAVVVICSLYVSAWAVIGSLWGAFGALVGCGVGGVVGGVFFLCFGRFLSCLIIIAAGCVCAGLSVFAFFGCKWLTKGGVWLTKKMGVWIKSIFIKKEGI